MHTRLVASGSGNVGEFKVPSLRNLILTAPYGRDGGVETIAEVVRHYSGSIRSGCTRGTDDRPALDLTPREQTDLVVFLESLQHLHQSVAAGRQRAMRLTGRPQKEKHHDQS